MSIQHEGSDEELHASIQMEGTEEALQTPSQRGVSPSSQQGRSEEELQLSTHMGSTVSTHKRGSAGSRVVKDGKIFQKVYMRNKRGKDKGKVTIKLKRLHIPVRRTNSVTNQQTVQLEGDVLVEDSPPSWKIVNWYPPTRLYSLGMMSW